MTTYESALYNVVDIDDELGLVMYEHKNYRELQSECRKYGIAAIGTKTMLVKRIINYCRAKRRSRR
jgi:hypothetical protein